MFFKSVSFPLDGYSTFVERLIVRFFKNKSILYRKIANDKNLSEAGLLPLINSEELYLKIKKDLDNYFQKYDKEDFCYKGVNVLFVLRRQLHICLTELYNRLYQIEFFQKQNPGVKFRAENKIVNILKAEGLMCSNSFFLTFVYGVLDILLKIKLFFKPDYTEVFPDLNSDCYFNIKKDKHNFLLTGLTVERNKTFINLSKYLNDSFDVSYVYQESKVDPDFTGTEFEKMNFTIDQRDYKKRADEIMALLKLKYNKNDLISYLLDTILLNNMKAGIFSIFYIIDLYELIHRHRKVDGIITGFTFYWIYNIAVQWAKKNNIRSIFFQDIFITEDYSDYIEADKVITSSSMYNEKLIKMGFPEEHVINSAAAEGFLGKTPVKLQKKSDKKKIRAKVNEELRKIGVNITQEKLVFVAADPGNFINTREQKYNSEYRLLKEIKNQKDLFTVIKLHPSDTGYISRLALLNSENKQAIVLKDIDFYIFLEACDVFISKYSTSVLEAVWMNKLVLLMNYDKIDCYKKLVDSGLAYYLENEGDFLKSYKNKISEFDKKREGYMNSLYNSENRCKCSMEKILRKCLVE
ncbi:MAG: hypothetical protein GY730_03095 [bacterium]|nr:hypothetical protein [bacterium]